MIPELHEIRCISIIHEKDCLFGGIWPTNDLMYAKKHCYPHFIPVSAVVPFIMSREILSHGRIIIDVRMPNHVKGLY